MLVLPRMRATSPNSIGGEFIIPGVEPLFDPLPRLIWFILGGIVITVCVISLVNASQPSVQPASDEAREGTC